MAKSSSKAGSLAKASAEFTVEGKSAPKFVDAKHFVALQSRVAVLEAVLRGIAGHIGAAPGLGITIDAEAGGSEGGGQEGGGGGSEGGGESGGDGGGSEGGGDGGDMRRPPKWPKGSRR